MGFNSSIVRYSFPTEIYFGQGSVALLPTQLRAVNSRRPLLVTDKGLANLPVFRKIFNMIEQSDLHVGTFTGIYGNPTHSQLATGVEAYKAHHADSIVALGGGAALDVAKAIALMANHPGHLFDYEDGKPDARPFNQPIPFLAAIPTTAGTGSEVGRSTVISDDETKVKKIIFDPCLLPKVVLADPELILDLPPTITAATGMDALSHLTESFLAPSFHPICDGIALEGVYLLSNSLVHCVNDIKNPIRDRAVRLHDRGLMMNAAMMGAIAFQKGLGVTHSCAHALSTVCDLHHGLANGIMITHAMAFNIAGSEAKFQRLARAVGLRGAHPEEFLHWLRQLQADVDIPSQLREVGVRDIHVDELVEFAFRDGCHQTNPKPVSRADFAAIFRAAL